MWYSSKFNTTYNVDEMRILKGIGQLYVTLCTAGVSLYIIVMIVAALV